MEVSVAEAKSKLTRLIRAVEKGEKVTISRRGKPVVDLIPAVERKKPEFGMLKGKSLVTDPDWARPQKDLEAWLRGDV